MFDSDLSDGSQVYRRYHVDAPHYLDPRRAFGQTGGLVFVGRLYIELPGQLKNDIPNLLTTEHCKSQGYINRCILLTGL